MKCSVRNSAYGMDYKLGLLVKLPNYVAINVVCCIYVVIKGPGGRTKTSIQGKDNSGHLIYLIYLDFVHLPVIKILITNET